MSKRIRIDDPADARLDPYRNLRDRVLRRMGDRFIAESRAIVVRMLDAGIRPESIVVDERRAESILAIAPDDVPVYVVSEPTLTALAGFKIHTGALAVARRPAGPTLAELAGAAGLRRMILVLSQLKEAANLGSIVRTTAAFGIGGMLLGPHCCDPYYRRAVRVSMGAVFATAVRTSADLRQELCELREAHGYHLAASVLDGPAACLHRTPRPPRLALLLGHEVHGLDPELTALCHSRLTIPMAAGVDSLNVSTSAAVLCHHFTHAAG